MFQTVQLKDSEDPQLRTYRHFYPEHWSGTCHWSIHTNKSDHSHCVTLGSKTDTVSLWAAEKTHISTYPVQDMCLAEPLLTAPQPKEPQESET